LDITRTSVTRKWQSKIQ